MTIINISNPEELFIFKYNIEKYLLDTNQIDKKYSPEEFINKYCDISKIIYIKDNIIIPFTLNTYNNELYLVVSDINNIDNLTAKLSTINYDLSKLKKLSKQELINVYINNTSIEQFIINNEYYI